jgi:hypothetical protein
MNETILWSFEAVILITSMVMLIRIKNKFADQPLVIYSLFFVNKIFKQYSNLYELEFNSTSIFCFQPPNKAHPSML